MRLPFFLGIHGRRVPDWLERVEPTHLNLEFRGLVIVWTAKRAYHLRPLFSQPGGLISVNGHGADVTVSGQSPHGDGTSVQMNLNPFIPSWLVGALLALTAMKLFF